jgi:protein SCO1/2
VKLTLVIALVLLAGCGKVNNLPSLGLVPDFTLTGETGKSFGSADLDGKIWVADFFFTTCQGPCPRMSTQMSGVQKAVERYPEVHLVSFTIDPRTDTPPVLAAYARRYKANPERWHFLTGTPGALNRLSYDTFHLGPVDGSLQHSTRFVLIDGSRRIRAYYLTAEKESIPQLLSDIEKLHKEGS